MYTKLTAIDCCDQSPVMNAIIYYELNLEEANKFIKLLTLRHEKDPFVCNFCNKTKRILTEKEKRDSYSPYSLHFKQDIKNLIINEIKIIKKLYAISPF